MTFRTVGIALLGAGIFAGEEHLPALLASKVFDLKAVYSRSQKSAKKLLEDSKTDKEIAIYSDDDPVNTLDALLARKDVEAINIVLPIHTQPEVIKKCFAANKHVISEKPIAGNLEHAKELCSLYESKYSHLIWQVGEQFRYSEMLKTLTELSQTIGKLSFFSFELYAHAHAGDKFFDTQWRQTDAFPGFLVDGGVHFAALTRAVLTTPIERVSAFTCQVKPYLPPIDTAHASCKCSNGLVGTFNISFGSDKFKANLFLVGDKGSLVFENFGSVIVRDAKDKVVQEVSLVEGMKTAVASELEGFAAGIASGKVEQKGSPKEALIDLAMIDAIMTSGKQNGAPQLVSV